MIKIYWDRLNFVLVTIFLVFVIVTSAYGANVELQNGSETSKIKLTENQKNILKAYGLSEDEIANIDLQTIRDTLRNGTIVDSSWFGDEPKYGTNDIPSHLEKIIASKNLSDRQMKGLRQRGYTYEEIAEMDNKTIESIVGSVSLLSASNANPPEGYQYVAEVPDGGGTNEYFHPDVSVTTNQLNWYVSASKEFTKHIYNMSSNPPIGNGII